MGNNPSSKTRGSKLPVTNVSWEDCQEFIKKLNAKTNGGYRLPTEAEWEYACRAGTSTAYSVGNSLAKADANYGEGVAGSIKEVGSYKPNPFGLYDMHGNVWERCADWNEDRRVAYPSSSGAVTDPKGPETGNFRVVRGGAFFNNESGTRSSSKGMSAPYDKNTPTGFRLAKTADVKAAVAPAISNPKPAVVMPTTGNLLVAPFTEAKAKEAQKEVAKSFQKEVEEKEDLGKGIKLDMVLIPAGKFMMGSPESETGRGSNETQHEVTLTKPYYMGKYEVTQEQWEAVMGSNPTPSYHKGANFPVGFVSWENCQEFIKKLNAKTNGGYRLPTEAEWEYACRGGTTTKYSFGEGITKKDADYDGSTPKLVGSYKPNAFGLYDMHGLMWEWCEDWYRTYPLGTITDPKGPPNGEDRVLRGGSHRHYASLARSSYRDGEPPSKNRISFSEFGFRLAKTP
jgi:formylglycine-generating enzyme required for sulfatase activity